MSAAAETVNVAERELAAAISLLSAALSSAAASPVASAPVPFGDYQLIRELGRGRFGIVWLASHAGVNREVALKRMESADPPTPTEIEQFRKGMSSAAELDHPNIVPVYHLGVQDGWPFMTLKYIKGKNLSEVLQDGLPSQDVAVRWMIDIVAGVAHAHRRNVLHCDLKPQNILIDLQQRAHVTDFGLAERLNDKGWTDAVSGGTPQYMAPEHMRLYRTPASESSRPLTFAADIFALGVVFYELLTGRAPYEDEAACLTAMDSPEPVPAPRVHAPHVNADLEAICRKCLEKEPTHRYARAELLLEDLKLVLDGCRPVRVHGNRPLRRAQQWLSRLAPRSVRALIGALIIAFVALLAVAALAWTELSHQRERETVSRSALQAREKVRHVLLQLEETMKKAEAKLHDRLIDLLENGDIFDESPALPSDLFQVLLDDIRMFKYVYFFRASDGVLIAQWWAPVTKIQGLSYAYRDYFQGTLGRSYDATTRRAPGSYVGRAFLAESNGGMQIALGQPVMGERGEVAGVLSGSIDVGPTLGFYDLGSGVALLAPRDQDRHTGHLPADDRLSFVVHPKLSLGVQQDLQLPEGVSRDAPVSVVADLEDPLDPAAGPGFAAFAPVGALGENRPSTGYFVLVRMPAKGGLGRTLTLSLCGVLSVALGAFIAHCGMIMRRRRSLRQHAKSGRRTIPLTPRASSITA